MSASQGFAMTAESNAVSPEPVRRDYEMRLVSHHGPENNERVDLQFAFRRVGEDWQPLTRSDDGSPFLNFLHCAFTCQLAYLRMNAAERGLALNQVYGHCQCDTLDFQLQRFEVSFAMDLRSGEASAEDLAYMVERCLACPVSVNLGQVPHKSTTVTADGSAATHGW